MHDRLLPRHNLTLQPTPLLARDDELAAARHLLLSGQIRLLTLTGPAGVGKTRLALALAAELLTRFPDGVWFVDLASVRDPTQVCSTIARTLGGEEAGYHSSAARLQAYLAERRVLLVLDNFEQVLAAAPDMAELLANCPFVTILVTSRARLRLRWEHVLPIRPLACADAQTPPTVQAAAAVPAVALFVERAQASDPAFCLTPDNLQAVVTLCGQLEGVPLALELAAARANTLTPEQMIQWVAHRLPALSWEAQDLPARQQTVRGALEWSYALLPAAEQALFRRLGVFVRGWTLDAAAAVTQVDTLGLDAQTGLSALVDASLVQVSENVGGESRFAMLETLREFAAEQLAASGELDGVRCRHAAHFATLAEAAEPGAGRGAQQRAEHDRLEHEHANLCVALSWAAEQGDSALELRLASSLTKVWWVLGYLHEGRQWLTDALERGGDAPAELRIRALEMAGLLAACLGELASATAQLEGALALARQLRNGRGTVGAPGTLVRAAALQGQTGRVLALAAELDVARASTDRWHLSFALHALGLLAHEAGDLGAAAAYLEQSLDLCRRTDDQYGVAYVLSTLAAVVHAQGDSTRAATLLREALHLAHELGCAGTIAGCAHVAVRMSAERRPAADLTRVLGGADALIASASPSLGPHQRARFDEIVASTRSTLGDQAFDTGWADGRTMTRDDLVKATLAVLEAPPAAAEAPPAAPGPERKDLLLSAREQEVLGLVAEGLTNKQIAQRLIISTATVNYHVTSVLNKLGAENRTQSVTLATQRGLL